MATSEKVVYLQAAAEQRKRDEKARDRALLAAGMKHKALCAKDSAARHITLSLEETAASLKNGGLALVRTAIRLAYHLLRLACTFGAAICLFFAVRDVLNSFPNGLWSFIALIAGALCLHCIKLTVQRLLSQAKSGSVFDIQRAGD